MSDRIITSAIATGKKLPMTAGRLDFLQNNVETLSASTIKGILGGYTTNDVIILYGCTLTGSDPGARTMTAGAIFYNDITYQVDAASFTTTGSNIPLWTKIETDSDLATYTDASTGNVRATTKFVLTQGPAGGSGITGYIADYNASNVKYLSDIQIGKFADITLLNGFTYGGGATVQYRKDINGIVTLNGTITAPVTITSEIIGTLPVGYRPTYYMVFPAYCSNDEKLYCLKIDGVGNLTLFPSGGGSLPASYSYFISGIRFPVGI